MCFKAVITCIIHYGKHLAVLQTHCGRAGDTVLYHKHLTLCWGEEGEWGGRQGEEEEKSPEYTIIVNFFSTYFVPISRVHISHISSIFTSFVSRIIISQMKISDLKTLTNLPVATQLTGHRVELRLGDWNLHSDFSEDHELQALQKIGVWMYIDTNTHRVFFH